MKRGVVATWREEHRLEQKACRTRLGGELPIEFPDPKQHLLCMCVLSWHGGVDVKRLGLGLGVCAGLVLAASSFAFALEEQHGAAPVATPGVDAPKAGVQDAAPVAKPETGPEIRIPGLGKLGTLPKMDFGLELLYGAADAKAPAVQEPGPQSSDPADDLTIRGSLKHNF